MMAVVGGGTAKSFSEEITALHCSLLIVVVVTRNHHSWVWQLELDTPIDILRDPNYPLLWSLLFLPPRFSAQDVVSVWTDWIELLQFLSTNSFCNWVSMVAFSLIIRSSLSSSIHKWYVYMNCPFSKFIFLSLDYARISHVSIIIKFTLAFKIAKFLVFI